MIAGWVALVVEGWRSRLVGHGEERAGDLLANPMNWRVHPDFQRKALEGVLDKVGWVSSVMVNKTTGHIVDGHLRAMATLSKYGEGAMVPIDYVELSEDEELLILASFDPISAEAARDLETLEALVAELEAFAIPPDVQAMLDELLGIAEEEEPRELPEGADKVPQVAEEGQAISRLGDVWQLGAHRVMCGDSINQADVSALFGEQVADLVHADPPYGMGKQADGVQNDNLYREKLDAFQVAWFKLWRTHSVENGSAYIWGNSPDLFRLWYLGGLSAEEVELRNHIVWHKGQTPGMKSGEMHQYPIASESALYLQFGNQFIGNVNAEDFWEGWAPILEYLEGEAKAAGLTAAKCKEITGVYMFSHWFTRSQWAFLAEKHYQAIAEAYPEHFAKPYRELHALFQEAKARYREELNGRGGSMRSYFDNTHEAMSDVWEYPRVEGEERHGHATPKPVEMMARVMRSSAPKGGLVGEPFGGSGSTLIGAEVTGRTCYTMELTPEYVDVIVKRWEKVSGGVAVHALTGETMAEAAAARGLTHGD